MRKTVFFTYYSLFLAKQEMSWQISRGLDKEGGKEKLGTRFPFLELQMFTYHFPGDEDGARKYFPGYLYRVFSEFLYVCIFGVFGAITRICARRI